MEAMLNFIPAPIAIALMLLGFVALAVGGIRLGYKATVKDLALELVEKAELSIMGSGQGAKKKKRCSRLSAPSARLSSSGQSPMRCWMRLLSAHLTL